MGSNAVASSGTTAESHQVAIHAASPATCQAAGGIAPGAGSASAARNRTGPTSRTTRRFIAAGTAPGACAA